jgi:CheY-like chemotaxis protein
MEPWLELRLVGLSQDDHGVTAIGEMTRQNLPDHVLVLTTYDTDRDVVPAIEAGATGYLLKDAPREELLWGVCAAARGESVLSPSVASRLIGQVRAPGREALSQRELEVLGLIARGTTNRPSTPEATARCQLWRCSWSAASAGAGQGFGGLMDGGESRFDVPLHRPQALVAGLGQDDVGGDVGLAEVAEEWRSWCSRGPSP